MRTIFIFIIFFISWTSFSQMEVRFSFDNAGNQTQRRYVNVWTKSQTNQQLTEILSETKDDSISFYPNPVQNELTLNWVNDSESFVKSIDLYDLNGKHLQSLIQNADLSNTQLDFSLYDKGVFLVTLTYSDNEQKSLKIIKK
jgi:hypothetical protein